MGKVSNGYLKVADELESKGYPYTAKYLRKFGVDNWNPDFLYGVNDKVEQFYKECVEQNVPWFKHRKG